MTQTSQDAILPERNEEADILEVQDIENQHPINVRVIRESNNDVVQLIEKLNRRFLSEDEIEGCSRYYVERNSGDKNKLIISFLKAFLAILPYETVSDIIGMNYEGLNLCCHAEALLDDFAVLHDIFHLSDSEFKNYLMNFKKFIDKMFASEMWSDILKNDCDVLKTVCAITRLMCALDLNRARETGNVGRLVILGWLLKNEGERHQIAQSEEPNFSTTSLPGTDNENEIIMQTLNQTLRAENFEDQITDLLKNLSYSIIQDSLRPIRLSCLEFIYLNCTTHYQRLIDHEILKALAFGIIDNPISVRLTASKILLKLLESEHCNQRLIDWFFEECSITRYFKIYPLSAIVESVSESNNVQPICVQIILNLESKQPGRIEMSSINYIFTNVCLETNDLCELLGNLVHSVLNRNNADSSQFMSNLVRFFRGLSEKVPVDYIVNTLICSPSSSNIFNCQLYLDHLMSDAADRTEKLLLLQLMECVISQLTGVFKVSEDTSKDFLVNDMTAADRRDRIASFLADFSQSLNDLLKNDNVKRHCLLECIDLIKKFPLVFFSENVLGKIIVSITNVLLDISMNHDVKLHVIQVVDYFCNGKQTYFKDKVQRLLKVVFLAFSQAVLKIYSGNPADEEVFRGISSHCANLEIVCEYFKFDALFENVDCGVLRKCLTKVLLQTAGNQVKIHEIVVWHSFLVIEVAKTLKYRIEVASDIDAPLNPSVMNLYSCSKDIISMMPKLIGWINSLQTSEEKKIFDILSKELTLLNDIKNILGENQFNMLDIVENVVRPLKHWMFQRIPIIDNVPRVTIASEAGEYLLEEVLKLIEEKILPFHCFEDVLAFCLYKKYPVALKIVTSTNNDVEVVSSILTLFTKIYFGEIGNLCLNSQNKSAYQVACEYMNMINIVIGESMELDNEIGRLLVQKSLEKIISFICEESSRTVPGPVLATLTFPWFLIILECCVSPTTYSYSDIQNWETLSHKHPRIASLITQLFTQSSDKKLNLQEEIRKLIYHPQEYLALSYTTNDDAN